MKNINNEIQITAHLLPAIKPELDKLRLKLSDAKVAETKRKVFYMALGLAELYPDLINECLSKGHTILQNSMHGANYANAN